MRSFALALACAAFPLGTTDARAECRPTAVPIGDPALVRSLSERLAANGISTTPARECPAVRVDVEQRGEDLHLRVMDAYQRRSERTVRDVATAAAIIESWTVQTVEAGALPDSPPTRTIAVAAEPRYAVSTAGRTAIGDDGSTWLGAAMHACVRVGWTCVGATIGVASDTTAVNDVSTGTHRSLAFDAMASADVRKRLGNFTASVGVLAGYGWNRIQQQRHDMHMQPLAISHANHALRTGTRLAIARGLASSLSLFAELFADVAALRTDIPDGPRARAGLSLGVRIGAP